MGLGKSYICKEWEEDDNYIVIDTDRIFGNAQNQNEYEIQIRNRIIELYGNDFENILYNKVDEWYLVILAELQNVNKTVVINSAILKFIKNLSIIKGKFIILRTSINKCYIRCIERYKLRNPYATKEEIQQYSERKKKMYVWYQFLNDFILKIDKI